MTKVKPKATRADAAKAGRRSTERATIRPLRAEDLDAVVALDRRQIGRSRRGVYAKRMEAIARRPEDFVALAAEDGGGLAGFAVARILTGEFGAAACSAALDMIGVDPAYRGRGLGGALLAAIEDEARTRGARAITTEAAWTEGPLLGFFAAAGFAVAPRLVVERPISRKEDQR